MGNPAPARSDRTTLLGTILSWAALYAAIALDVAQVFALDYSDGLSNPLLAATAVGAFVIELYLFSVALRRIATTVAVGLFGLGTAAVAVISISWLGEPLTALKGVALLALIVGAGLLNTDSAKPDQKPRSEEGRRPRPRRSEAHAEAASVGVPMS